MPKNKLQEVIFTILMVLVMVYAMVCYNIALSNGSMQNWVFVAALHELPLMGALAFVLDFFVVGHLAKKIAMRLYRWSRNIRFIWYSQFLRCR